MELKAVTRSNDSVVEIHCRISAYPAPKRMQLSRQGNKKYTLNQINRIFM